MGLRPGRWGGSCHTGKGMEAWTRNIPTPTHGHCHCDTVESVRPQTPPAGDRNQWGPQGVRIPCQAVVTVPRWKVWSAVQDEASELLWGDKPAALMTALPASGLLARALRSLCADRRWTCSRGYGCLPLAPCAEVTKLHP